MTFNLLFNSRRDKEGASGTVVDVDWVAVVAQGQVVGSVLTPTLRSILRLGEHEIGNVAVVLAESVVDENHRDCLDNV